MGLRSRECNASGEAEARPEHLHARQQDIPQVAVGAEHEVHADRSRGTNLCVFRRHGGVAKQTSNSSESASACAVDGSTPEASLTSSCNALNCHADRLRLQPGDEHALAAWFERIFGTHFLRVVERAASR